MPSTEEKEAAWTFLVYLAGDNNLTQEMAWGLQELKKTAIRVNPPERKSKDGKRTATNGEHRINVVAHFDPRGSRGRRYDFYPLAENDEPASTAGKDGNLDRYEAMVFTPSVVRACTREFVHRLDAPAGASPGASAQLAAFLGEQLGRRYRSKHFFVVLSGHGSGAVGDFLTDLDPTTSLSIPELARILGAGREAYERGRSEHDGLGRISILGMDSCLMSNAEVCFEVREHAEFLVASEGFVENTGWPYHRVLEALIDPRLARPFRKAGPVAVRVAEHYASFYRDQEVAGVSTDIAVCDLAAFRAEGSKSLISRLGAFSRECIPRLEGVHVQEALDTVFARRGAGGSDGEAARGRAVLERLSRDIARDLSLGSQDRDRLVDKLVNGSTRAREELATSPWRDPLAPSQLEALRQLLDSIEGRYDLQEELTLADRLVARAPRLLAELAEPSSHANVLAAVRVLREFDPGVEEALRLIQAQDAQRNPKAKRARARLLKLHHVRWWLDLYELSERVSEEGKRTPPDFRLRDDLVLARFAAQSFKAGIYVDLLDLCRNLLDRLPVEDRLRPLCVEVQKAIEGTGRRKGAVVKSFYTGPAFQHAHGLSVYFPSAAEDYTSEYENLELAERTAWGRFLRAYLRVTRRDRRDERKHWASMKAGVLRFGDLEADPLEEDGIEARIAGATALLAKDDGFRADEIQAGTKKRLRAGAEGKIRAGSEGKIRAGSEGKIRAGSEGKIKGEGILAVWGNPSDGFFRQ